MVAAEEVHEIAQIQSPIITTTGIITAEKNDNYLADVGIRNDTKKQENS